MPLDLQILTLLRSLVEVAGLMLLIRGAIWLFGPGARNNIIYGLFTVGSMPFIRFARAIMPRAVRDAYMPTIAFLMLFTLWIAMMLTLAHVCVTRGLQCG